MIPLLASLHPSARSIPKVHKQGTPTRKACTGCPEFKHLDSWALWALPGACLPRLTPLYPAPQHSSLQFAPGSHYCLLFLPFVCALSSMPFSPWSPMYVPTYRFKLSSGTPSSGKLYLSMQNDLCCSHRTSHCMTTNQYISHLSLPLGQRTGSSWTIKMCTKVALHTPSPLIIRCVPWNMLF